MTEENIISNGDVSANINKDNTKINYLAKFKNLINNKYFFFLIIATILIVNVYVRIGMINYPGLFEPDGYYYYTAIKQSVAQGFTLPTRVYLSGYPTPNLRGEDPGLIYMTTIPYFFLRYLGVSILDIMRSIGVVFGVLDAIAAYFLLKYLSKSRLLSLFAMLFVSLSSGNIARTAALIYRGDVWVSFFLMIALIMMFVVINQKENKKKYIYTILTGFLVSLGFLIWTGGVIIPELFLVATGALVFYAFIIADNKLNFDIALLLIASFISFILGIIYVSSGIAYGTMMNGIDFFVLFIPILILLIISYIIILLVKQDNALFIKLFGNYKSRFITVVVILLLALFMVISIPILNNIITNGHAIYESSNIGSTTQELQSPTFSFLLNSFGIQLFLAPLGIIFFIFFADIHGNETKTYLNIKRWKITINTSSAFIILLTYFVVMAYLQGGAIRFNSMLSIPMAIFSAYAVYSGYLVLKRYNINISKNSIPASSIIIGLMIALIIIQFTMVYQQSYTSGPADGVNPQFFQALEWLNQNTPKNATVLALWPDGSLVEGIGERRSFMDSVGGENAIRIEQYHSYLLNGTSDNAYLYNTAFKPDYILARNFWYDELAGIAIEGNITNPFNVKGKLVCSDSTDECSLYAKSLSSSNPGSLNGTIYMSYNGTTGYTMLRGYGYANILVDGISAGQIVLFGNMSNQNGNWNGLLSFNNGLIGNLEINGLSKSNLSINGSLENNLQNYGFTILNNFSSTNNSTANIYKFYNPSIGYEAILVMQSNSITNTPKINAYLGFVNNPTNFIPLKNIEFLNTSNYNYNIITTTSNTFANYTLLIQYSGKNINSASLLGSKLVYTNMFKMLDECSFISCALSSGNVTAQLVYANGDSKIIKMTYK
jgi:dolichyl-diphosphooligosaccharide--protein glycosyltransferase